MTATLVLSGTSRLGTADRLEGAGVGADPVGERLGPARLGVGEVGSAQCRDKDLRRSGLAGQPVDDHRHRVAGVIDEQLVAAGMVCRIELAIAGRADRRGAGSTALYRAGKKQ